MEGKVIGIGGVFLKFKDPSKMNKWYAEILGMTPNDYGILFSFNDGKNKKGYLQLGTFSEDSDYFGSSKQQVMLNFRVDNLEKLIEKLRLNSVELADQLEIFDYGKFIHINDPEGNRIELWEPIDDSFSEEPTTDMK
jgi:predicted enzyme related to lactoylglutathione lyase